MKILLVGSFSIVVLLLFSDRSVAILSAQTLRTEKVWTRARCDLPFNVTMEVNGTASRSDGSGLICGASLFDVYDREAVDVLLDRLKTELKTEYRGADAALKQDLSVTLSTSLNGFPDAIKNQLIKDITDDKTSNEIYRAFTSSILNDKTFLDALAAKLKNK